MKVQCIYRNVGEDNKISYRWITIDKIYNVYEISNSHYIILDDKNEKSAYRKNCFVDIVEVREEKLKKLGI